MKERVLTNTLAAAVDIYLDNFQTILRQVELHIYFVVAVYDAVLLRIST